MNDTLLLDDGNQTVGGQLVTQNTVVNMVTVVFGLVIAVWTVLSNSFIVLCFMINRNKRWPSFSRQILSLSLSDMCVGLTSLPLAMLPMINTQVNYGVCSLLFFLFFASQCASLYHILGICVHRCIVIRKVSGNNSQPSTELRVPLILAISAWLLSFIVCSIPNIVYGDPDAEIKLCVLHTVFNRKVRQVTGYFFMVYFVPQILTTILYIYVCCRLKCVWKKVYPDQQTESTSNTVHVIASIQNQMNVTSDITSNRTNIRIQKNVIGTIGVLMLFFNICTIPIIVLFQMENQNVETARNLRFIASAMFILNSALNPFVYALRTDWLKKNLRKMFRDVFNTICPC